MENNVSTIDQYRYRYQNKFRIVKGSNRTWRLMLEIERAYHINRGQIFGLIRAKGVNGVDYIFRQVQNADSSKNRTALFLYKLRQLPNRKFKKQMKLKL